MEGCWLPVIRQLQNADDTEIRKVLKQETSRLEVTKSLLSILYNICLAKSVPLNRKQKEAFREHNQSVLRLLSGASHQVNKTADLTAKKRVLARNPALVRIIAKACPPKPDA